VIDDPIDQLRALIREIEKLQQTALNLLDELNERLRRSSVAVAPSQPQRERRGKPRLSSSS
jgi:hypothetical protein